MALCKLGAAAASMAAHSSGVMKFYERRAIRMGKISDEVCQAAITSILHTLAHSP